MLEAKLWARFVIFSVHRYVHGQRPLSVLDKEVLGRELRSSRQFTPSTGRIKPNAFEPPKGKQNISVDRLSLVSRALAVAIGNKHSRARGRTFYGFAEISAGQVRETKASVSGRPALDNPIHGNIQLPPDDGRDFILDIARQLAERAQFSPP